MNLNQKIKTITLLFLIITLNTYVGCKREEKEGFIKGIVDGVLNLVPVEPVKDFLQKEVGDGGDGFGVLISLGFGIFKLIVIIGVMPFVMLFAMKAAVIGGMTMVTTGMFSFFTWFTGGGSAASIIQNVTTAASSSTATGVRNITSTSESVKNLLKSNEKKLQRESHPNSQL